MSHKDYKNLLAVVDQEMKKVTKGLSPGIQCRKGCAHCCEFLVEIVWEEAEIIANCIRQLMGKKKKDLLIRLRKASKKRRDFFSQKTSTYPYRQPTRSAKEMPLWVFDDYYFKKKWKCPFLVDNACQIYKVRPVACRFHVVNSDPDFCRRKALLNDDQSCVPKEIEKLKNKLSKKLLKAQDDERWGELSIMVTSALDS